MSCPWPRSPRGSCCLRLIWGFQGGRRHRPACSGSRPSVPGSQLSVATTVSWEGPREGSRPPARHLHQPPGRPFTPGHICQIITQFSLFVHQGHQTGRGDPASLPPQPRPRIPPLTEPEAQSRVRGPSRGGVLLTGVPPCCLPASLSSRRGDSGVTRGGRARSGAAGTERGGSQSERRPAAPQQGQKCPRAAAPTGRRLVLCGARAPPRGHSSLVTSHPPETLPRSAPAALPARASLRSAQSPTAAAGGQGLAVLCLCGI